MFGHTFIPFRRFPHVFPVVTSILLVQTVIYIVLLSTGHVNDPNTWVQYGAYIDWRIDQGEWWRYISSTFVHVNLFQLIFISFFLYVFGPQLEWLMGRFFFTIFYLLTGSLANIGYYIFDISGVHTGANGAIYGILGFYLYLYVRRLIDPNSGLGLLLLVVINLVLNWGSIFAYLLSLFGGFLLGMIIIEIRRLKAEEEDEEDQNR